MTGNLRRGLVVGGAGVALVGVLLLSRDDVPDTTTVRRPVRGAARGASAKEVPVVDVRLERLRDTPPDLEDVERNLFRFASRSAPESGPGADTPRDRVAPPGPVASAAAAAAGPPALPPIPLRYIGLLDAPARAGRVAILSDGQGNIFYGREGDTIEGRYAVITVGPISAELAYLDGRGRQTIRLSGQ